MSDTNARFQLGGLILPRGSSPGDINAGEGALILDADGSVRLKGPTGIKVTPGDVGLIATAGAAVQDLTVSGLSGDTDGGYEIEGRILTTAAAPDYVLYLNGATVPAGGGSSGNFASNTPSVAGIGLKADLYIASNNSSEISNITFRIRIGSKQGVMQTFTSQAFSRRGTGTICLAYNTAGQFTMGAEITSLAIHSSVAGTIDAGSFVRVRRLGFTA